MSNGDQLDEWIEIAETDFLTARLSDLALYGVRARYPGDIMSLVEAKEAVETAKRVRTFVRKYLAIK